jgi:hypothetical protein
MRFIIATLTDALESGYLFVQPPAAVTDVTSTEYSSESFLCESFLERSNIGKRNASARDKPAGEPQLKRIRRGAGQ